MSSSGDNSRQALLSEAMKALQAKNFAAAHRYCQTCLQQQESDPVSLHLQGVIYLEQGRLLEASQWVQRALKENTHYAEAYNTLGIITDRLGQPQKAIQCFEQALQSNPEDPDVLKNLAMVHLNQGELKSCEQRLQQGLRLQPNHSSLLNGLGLLQMKRGELTLAQTAYENAIAANPGFVDAHCNLAWVLEQQNQLTAARARYERVIELQPNHCKAYYSLSGLKQAQVNDPAFEALERLKLTRPRSPQELSDLYFALGKMYGDIRNDDASFLHYQFGNKAWQKLVPYDAIAHRQNIHRLIKATPASAFETREGASNSDRPIFIVGMPRSGTTLVEQILSSHPEVHGAGELEWIGKLSNHCLRNASSFEAAVQSMTSQQRAAYGAEYLKQLTKLNQAATRVVDKMPDNFQSLWFIAQIFPNAKVIHLRRHPLDTCVACYTTHFFAGHPYTCDLTHLGMYYTDYRTVMDHWKTVLPIAILELDYEKLVMNQATESRRLIDFLGLPWHDDCLAFHANPRAISTASVTQVRKPIYTSSINRWKRYEAHISRLIEEVKPFLS